MKGITISAPGAEAVDRSARRQAPLSIHNGTGPARNGDSPLARTALQRSAPATLRKHTLRHLARIGALVTADLTAYFVLWTGIQVIRDAAVPGSWIPSFVTTYFPQGFLGGWQFAAALLVGFAVTGNYLAVNNRRSTARLFSGCLLATALVLWHPLWSQEAGVVLMQFLVIVPSVWLTVCATRFVADEYVIPLWMNGHHAAHALLVGTEGAIREAERRPLLSRDAGFRVAGRVVVDGRRNGKPGGALDSLQEVVHRTGADTIFVCGSMTDDQLNKVVEASVAGGCELLAFARSLAVAGVAPRLAWYSDFPVMRLTTPALKGQQMVVKRLVDLTASIIGLILLAPVFAAIAVAIKLDSKGPVFFGQERAGLGGSRFRMVKFRTMGRGADLQKEKLRHLNHTGDPRLFKIPNDPRITRVGRFLRRWSLDELPQLWNVVKGDMSLVGPRPFFESDLETYEAHHFHRLGAKPGITGLWQVNGRSSVVDFEEVVRMDREYIERWSVGLDLKILALTVPAVVRRTGAY